MSFFTDPFGFLLEKCTALIRRYTTFQLVLIAWAMWIAMPIAINMMWIVTTPMWIVITAMWMAVTKMWITITSMYMTMTTSYDPLDLAFKLWLSIMTFLIFRMGIKYSKRLDLYHDRHQQTIDELNQKHCNSLNGVSIDLIRIADCLKHTMHEIKSMKQELRRAQVPSDRINKMKENLKKFLELKLSAVAELNKVADDLDKYFSRINKGQIGGSAVSITGGIVMIVGLALTPFTFGTSVILSITGGVISGAGSGVAGGFTAFDWYQSRKSRKTVTAVLDKYNEALAKLKLDCLEIGNILKINSTNMDTENKSWCKFWSNLFLGTSAASKLSWNAIVNPILLSFRLASAAEDAVTLTMRGFTIAGAVPVIGSIVGICMIPFDIGFLVRAAVDVHQQNPHRNSNGIRNLAVKLNKNNPTHQDIENMIETTFQPRTIQIMESFV